MTHKSQIRMLGKFKDFKLFLKQNHDNTMINKKTEKFINRFNFIFLTKDGINDYQFNTKINKIKIIIVNYYDEEGNYFILCFDEILIIIEEQNIDLLYDYFNNNNDSTIYFLTNSEQFFERKIKISFKMPKDDQKNISNEINIFNDVLQIKAHNNKSVTKFWNIIKSSISGFLIQKSFYIKRQSNRLDDFKDNKFDKQNIEKIELTKDNYIKLFFLTQSNSSIYLIYHLDTEQIFILKTPVEKLYEINDITEREFQNYSKFSHPYLPLFYGTANLSGKRSLIIEFINFTTLNDIKKLKLNTNEKMKIIFQLMVVFEFLHNNHHVYRDLKPNNVTIDHNKSVVLIDFDRMIDLQEYKELNSQNHTRFFDHDFIAPEIGNGTVEYASDIYSLGLMIYFILMENFPKCNKDQDNNENKYDFSSLSEKYPQFVQICKNCTYESWEKRMSIHDLIDQFYVNIYSKIHVESLFHGLYEDLNKLTEINTIKSVANVHTSTFYKYWIYLSNIDCCNSLLFFGDIYFNGINLQIDNCKSYHYFYIASVNNDNSYAHYTLCRMYYDGIYVRQNTIKALEYGKLAADKQNTDVFYYLGIIYLEGKNIEVDIAKSIYYLKLSSKYNYAPAQNDLGKLYSDGKYIPRNINKAIKYYSLAAKQNYSKAQYNLGLIYLKENMNQKDINKAIYYLKLSADQNNIAAIIALGMTYLEGKYIKQDIYQGLQYLNKASNLNDPDSQHLLGTLYYNGDYVQKDINKCIYYFTLAANQNYCLSQFFLALIYLDDHLITKNIDQAIYYLTAIVNLKDQNLSKYALYELSYIYLKKKYGHFDIEKGISTAINSANLGFNYAQEKVGKIFYKGKLVSQNITNAIFYFKLAANQDMPYSQYMLGLMYYYGNYMDKNINKGIKYLSNAAINNEPNAQFILGNLYYEGREIPRDINKSIYYFEQASNQNDNRAQFNLCVIFFDGKYIKPNIDKSIYYLQLSAQNNNYMAQNNLGGCYLNGNYVTQDRNKAKYYFTLSANQGCAVAQYNLGLMYKQEKDINNAKKWLKLASNQNYCQAQLALGIIYLQNFKNSNDIEKSIFYLTQAAEKNDSRAQAFLGYLYYTGDFVTRDFQKAFHYYKLAGINSPEAQFFLAIAYIEGKFIQRDIDKGINYLLLAAKQKYPVSYLCLGKIYYMEEFGKKDLHKSFDYFLKAAKCNIDEAQNIVAIFYWAMFQRNRRTIYHSNLQKK